MMLYRTLDAVMPEFRAIFAAFDLTEPQWRVLRVLWAHDGASVVELARATLVAAPSLVGVLDRLHEAGLIERRPAQRDRRRVRVFLRPRGRALEKRVRPMVEAAYGRLQRMLTVAEWRALYDALDRLIEVRTAESVHQASLGVRQAVAARRTALLRRLGDATPTPRTAPNAARRKRS
ncbi:MAG TPA: MarR family transcriptional regulator [Candidatus Binatia bacterium]|jgi:homoprotocatechuate degradation regulator HpaR